MSDLLSSLTLASRSLEAQHRGLDVTGQNIANVNTPGYSKRVVDLASVAPPDKYSAGNGAEAIGIRAMRDRLLDRRLEQELPSERREAAMSDSLSVVEAALGQPGQSIDANLGAFFNAFSSLAENPQSAVARHEVLLQGSSLASSFRSISDRLTTALRDTDTQVRAAVDDVNTLAGQIASINALYADAHANGSFPDLQDQQTQLVRKLSELIDVSAAERSDGGVDVSFGNGRPLVIGATPYSITARSTPPNGLASLVAGDATVTSEITGGRLGGLLQVRDVMLPSYMKKLDTLASEIVKQVNSLHSAGFDQTGAPAGDFFAFSTPVAGVDGAAAAIQVSPGVANDPRLIAAGSTNQAGDNNTARAIAGLRETRTLDGGTATLTDGWSQLVYRVGRDAQAAQQEQKTRADIVRQVDALRDQVSGVSLDEEAMQMLKYQRAYEAIARYFNAVGSTLDVLMRTIAS